MATIGELCARDVVTAISDMPVVTAAKVMRQQHVGCIVVIERVNGGLGLPVGIVTDRDIVLGVIATDLDPRTITVGDIMANELVTARATTEVLEAMQIMRFNGVRRLPVVTEEGRLMGLVAFDDLLERVTEELSELTKVLAREQAREAARRK
jgi:CBS domain-containing protein